MAFSSVEYLEQLLTIPPNSWTRVGTVVPAGKHRCVSIVYSNDLADVVSIHVGSAAPAGNPSLRSSVSLDDGGGIMSNPHMVKAGMAVWVKTVLGKGAVTVEGYEEDN